NTRQVAAVEEVSPEVVAAQIDAVFKDIGVDAVKIGMLSSTRIVRAVAERLQVHRPPAVVLDPVMIAKSGTALLADDAVSALREELLPLATLVTPNLPEAELLTGLAVDTVPQRLAAARCLEQSGPAVLIKGGHGDGAEVVDILFDGEGFERFRHPRIDTSSTHGTGCTLSSAIAALLGAGEPLNSAVSSAIEYLQGAIVAAFPLGAGHGPVNHFYRWSAADQE
ncbi:MAG: bifunctional hydroxymethylpyrimidine kinase/phosphomethylpyrimidine kinase, partial [Acidobacteriota bacterium]